MAFKMKHYRPFQQMEKASQERKNLMMDNPVDKHASPMNMYDKKSPMDQQDELTPLELTAEGKKKIMKSDANPAFKKAIAKSPVNQGTKIKDKIAAGKEKRKTKAHIEAHSKSLKNKKIPKVKIKKKKIPGADPIKSPLKNKENKAEVKAAKEGKSGKEKRQAAREVRKQQRKEGKRGVKKTVKKVEKAVDKVKKSKIYKVAKGVSDTVSNVKKGKIGAAIKSGKQTIADAKKKKSDSPATMKKHKY